MELTVDQALQQGIAAHKEGRLQEAERLYQAILKTEPTHPEANNNLGVLCLYLNKPEVAIPLFKIAVKANPNMEEYWINYINTLLKKQHFQNAKKVLAQAKQRGFAGKKINALEAQITPIPQSMDSKLPEQKSAMTFYAKRKVFSEKEKAENPSSTNLNSLIESYQRSEYADAEQLAISIIRQFPNHQFSWKVLAAVYRQTGRIPDALFANKKSVALAPQDAEAHSNLGNTLKDLGRLKEAEASHRQALKLTPSYPELHINLSITLKELGQLKESEESCRQAIALKPLYGEAHYNLGNTLKELGRLKEAEASYRQAIAQKENYFQAHCNLGITLKGLGRSKCKAPVLCTTF
jgi:tetratricopeptide (TPR) repeat protein